MSTRIALTHHFEQFFDRPVNLATHWLRLHPAPHSKPEIKAWSLRIEPEPHFLNWVKDSFGNHQARLDFPEPVNRFCLKMDFLANLKPVNPFDFIVESYANHYPFAYPEQLEKELKPYLQLPAATTAVSSFLDSLPKDKLYIVEKLSQINLAVHNRLNIKTAPPGDIDLEKALKTGEGSPSESAWLLTVSLRSLGLAARFTSGYRLVLVNDPKSHDEPSAGLGGSSDTAALHAWSEVYLPGAGWIGLDPAAGIFINECYIPLASTPAPQRALPWIREFSKDHDHVEPLASQESVKVRRLLPKPAASTYSETQLADMEATGQYIDTRLNSDGLHLAMASSISFTASNGYSEWINFALGYNKRIIAETLLDDLKESLAPGGVYQQGQGEWFSGENLPRWSLSCYYRADGIPLWRNPALMVAASTSGEDGHSFNTGSCKLKDAETLGQILAKNLGLSTDKLIPAYEDPLYRLWSSPEGTITPPAETLNDPEQRRRFAAQLSEQQQEPAGYVLPLRWDGVQHTWTTSSWQFRRNALYLMPGNSPLGYRLPLASLPAQEAATREITPDRCPFEERPLLSEIFGEACARLTTYQPTPPTTADENLNLEAPSITALCIQVRNGYLHLFLPPLTHLEHWLDLLAVIEDTATQLQLPIALEGYAPPPDYRLLNFKLEPDVGILRLTLPMADNWESLRNNLQTAYEKGWNLGLLNERIADNGRRQPPGGGSEIILGGQQPKLSPFLNKPELLRSLISFWQRHPSLSYLFAGRMIGPSGPAPRPDEGRDDALYELDIALSRLPGNESATPWVSDRVLRHILIDPAGSIHKAEIRIDQLYGPDRSNQRQGRISIGSFETAPTPQQALAQNLLVRALLDYFATRPYDKGTINFGSALHDKFMLPEILWEDLQDVIGELNSVKLPIQTEWYKPFIEQRFPLLGKIAADEVVVELRTAHEPWPLLAEEVVGGSVTRFLDSANQRIQVSVSGYLPSRHILLCNGLPVPLQAGKIRGRYVGGVRYKVWNPPSTLHPTLPALSSLVFDLVDAHTGRICCGCTWIPTRPGFTGAIASPALPMLPEMPHLQQKHRAMPAHGAIPWKTEGTFLTSGSGRSKLDKALESKLTEGFEPRYMLDLSHNY